MKIIVVDDDPLVCQSLRLLLSRESDMEVIAIASDGEEAIQRCAEELPDIMLMDIRMPGMDGIQATRQIKQRWPQVTIMMLTTFQDEQNIRLALLAGAAGYMLKSTQVTSMAQQLRTLASGTSVVDVNVLKTLTTPEQDDLSGSRRERPIFWNSWRSAARTKRSPSNCSSAKGRYATRCPSFLTSLN